MASRNIVICADGTGNAYVGRPSNAARMVELLAMEDPQRQVVAYDQGIGTDSKSWKALKRRSETDGRLRNLHALSGPHDSWFPPARWWGLARGLAVGTGLRENVQQMYEWLAGHHQDETDRVYLFGFSRGALTVRALAGLLFRCGLSSSGGAFDAAWALYEPMRADVRGIEWFRSQSRSRGCQIHFLGLWDTVKSYGGLRPVLLPHLRHNPIVKTVCHALALDEHRGWFDATSWGWLDHDRGIDAAPASNEFAASRLDAHSIEALSRQEIEEVWFSGSHSDVGGGNGNDATSDISLMWMLAEATCAGLLLDDAGHNRFRCHTGNEVPTLTDSRTWWWRVLERIPRRAIDNAGQWPTTIDGVVGPADRKAAELLRSGRAAVHVSALTRPTDVDIRPVLTRRDDVLQLSTAQPKRG
jgi:uncharacterized protein (DUF2235 family)